MDHASGGGQVVSGVWSLYQKMFVVVGSQKSICPEIDYGLSKGYFSDIFSSIFFEPGSVHDCAHLAIRGVR
jgi:hypothetical protein